MKKRLVFCVIAGILVTALIVTNSYALLEDNASSNNELSIGKWVIKLNEEDISTGAEEDIIIDGLAYTTDTNVESGYIAPGLAGYFDLEIDPGDTDVSIEYSISVDISDLKYPDNIVFSIENLNDPTQVIENGIFEGVMLLSQIDNGEKINLRIGIEWQDIDEFDLSDGEFGSNIKNGKLAIPVSVKVNQYIE